MGTITAKLETKIKTEEMNVLKNIASYATENRKTCQNCGRLRNF
jgi:hypothetical protein